MNTAARSQWTLASAALMAVVFSLGATGAVWAQTNTVDVGAVPGPITIANPVRAVPVTINRTDLTSMRGFSVTFSVSSSLNVQGGTGGIHEGTYLSSANPVTSFNLIDVGTDELGNHSYTADCAILGEPCGADAASGTLFTIDLASAAAGGSGTVTITNIELRDCSNVALPDDIGAAATVTIDQSAPSVQVSAPNGGEIWHVGSSQNITWTGSDAEGVASYELAYSTDGGTTYPNTIATVAGTETSYAWTIPASPGTTVRVRATALDVNENSSADAGDANFTIAYYTLTYLAGANGTISGTTPQSVAHGASGTAVTAVPDPGHHFTTWSDAVLTAVRTDTNVTADINVTASFEVNPPVAAVTNLVATKVSPGTLDEQTTPVQVSWDATPPGTTVEVWRNAFGGYPEYDDAGGTVPSASASYPPGPGWVKVVDLDTPGETDLVGTRNVYYYVAYAQDVFGTWSPASSLTGGTLNYHLGDVGNGLVPGTGNNKVFSEDVSLLGFHYGKTGALVGPVNYLDVGPTTTLSVNGRPTTDDRIDFEDLVMFAVNYGIGQGGPGPLAALPVANQVANDEVVLDAPREVSLGESARARLTMRGTGAVIAVAARLTWNPAVVEPAGHQAGDWLAMQGGQAFSAAPGAVDAAVFGGQGLAGEGDLATVTFRAIAAGDPRIRIDALEGRDAWNRVVEMTQTLRPQGGTIPSVTQLAFARPNPFRDVVTIPFSLSARGPVSLELYSVDGRRVRTLVNETRDAGQYDVTWDGRDEHGADVMAGVYYLRMVTAQGRFTRRITNLK